MTLNEFVLTSLEGFESFAIITKTIEGKYREVFLDEKLYEKLEGYDVKDYYLDINRKTNQPYIAIRLEDYC